MSVLDAGSGVARMSLFVLGIIIGCFLGAIATLVLLLGVYSIPDGDYLRSQVPQEWRGIALIVGLMIVSGAVFAFLDLRRVAFATSVLLLLVFLAAHVRGMLVSWMTLGVATLILCMILPPTHSLSIADPQDQILLIFFVLCGAIGTRMITHAQKA
jgi:K+-sensing histidine kinase KdpD